jgi:hypothetical protein
MAWNGSATTTAMNPRPRLVEWVRRPARWLVPAAFLVLVPKCFLCVLAYAGIATGLGLGGAELCGDAATPRTLTPVLALLGLSLLAGGLLIWRPGKARAASAPGLRPAEPPADRTK